jgi:hypothetical protein
VIAHHVDHTRGEYSELRDHRQAALRESSDVHSIRRWGNVGHSRGDAGSRRARSGRGSGATWKEQPARLARTLVTEPWTVTVDGECNKPAVYLKKNF